jgi:hypothetical protein
MTVAALTRRGRFDQFEGEVQAGPAFRLRQGSALNLHWKAAYPCREKLGFSVSGRLTTPLPDRAN